MYKNFICGFLKAAQDTKNILYTDVTQHQSLEKFRPNPRK